MDILILLNFSPHLPLVARLELVDDLTRETLGGGAIYDSNKRIFGLDSCRESNAPSPHLRDMAHANEFSFDEAIAVLGRTPAALDALLRGLPEVWVQRNEGQGTWSAFDIVGHLIFGERTDWMPRLRIILENGETRAFDPFDRFAQFKESQGKSLEQLLEEFAQLRTKNLADLHLLNLQPADFARHGRHAALGPVTLSELLAAWAVHDLTHLHQLSRVMAHQYREAIGPWSAYMGVMQCDGHSAP